MAIHPGHSFAHHPSASRRRPTIAGSASGATAAEDPIRPSRWSVAARHPPDTPSASASATRFQVTAVAFTAIATAALWARALNLHEPAGTGNLPAAAEPRSYRSALCLGAATLLRAQAVTPISARERTPWWRIWRRTTASPTIALQIRVIKSCLCTYGWPDASTRVAVVGDSHAAAPPHASAS